jgi:hypothetical protein
LNPCGLLVDYAGTFQHEEDIYPFWDAPDVPIRIYWYRVPSGTNPLPFPSPFVGRSWDIREQLDEPVIGTRYGPYTRYTGPVPLPGPGTVCADAELWLNGLSYTKYLAGDYSCTCQLTFPPIIAGEGGVHLGGTATFATGSYVAGQGGLVASGTGTFGSPAFILGQGGVNVSGETPFAWHYFTAVLTAGTFASINLVGGIPWINPANAASIDSVFATSALVLATPFSEYLETTNYSPAIPAPSKVDGVEVTITRKKTGGPATADQHVQLSIAGAPSGTDKASGTAWGGTSATITYGGPTDTWGLTLSDTDVNASTFGVAMSAQRSGGGLASSAQVDAVQVKYYYTTFK